MSQPSIAIIGGGPSGLVFARLLESHGVTDFVVFERDVSAVPTPWHQGGTLDIHGSSGQVALRRAGLFDEFSRLARWDATCFSILDNDGETIFKMDEPRDTPEIDRLQLRNMLLASIPAEKIRWGHAVSTIDKTQPSVDGKGETSASHNAGSAGDYTINFTNGTSASGFRLIVGADGAWSKVRPLVTSALPVYSGKMYIEGYLSRTNPEYPAAAEMAGPGIVIALGQGKQIAIQQVSNGSYRVYFGAVVPEDFHHTTIDLRDAINGTEAARRLFLSPEFYASWAAQLRKFVENTEGPFRPWPLYNLPADAVGWDRDVVPRGVTLLGDAAHVSTPFVGEGVNCSMHDAVALFDCLMRRCGNSTGDSFTIDSDELLELALADYEKDMFERGRDLIRRSQLNEEQIFSEAGAAAFVSYMATLGENNLPKDLVTQSK
ncbi:FAD/NAD(P)-binding domain-containing protein [Thozetella sp. PMI_491]|nr:FAD/NAD(P)-binding domain-containing protein [Thozetella sp. PMI_491]